MPRQYTHEQEKEKATKSKAQNQGNRKKQQTTEYSLLPDISEELMQCPTRFQVFLLLCQQTRRNLTITSLCNLDNEYLEQDS